MTAKHYVPTPVSQLCNYRMKRGWWCSRKRFHRGPCALRPTWWNLPGLIRYGRWL